MLERVGLPGAQDKRVDQLSGGQKQRVAIARSLVLEPTLLLLDEPLGALDLKLREHMKIELKQLQADFGTTFVYITHDQSEALVLSDHVAVMNARPLRAGRHAAGALLPAGARRSSPASSAPTTASRARRLRVDGDIVEVGDGARDSRVRARRAGRIAAGDAVEAFVRPEVVDLARDGARRCRRRRSASRGVVESLLFDGANSAVLVREDATRAEIRIALPQTGALRRSARRRDASRSASTRSAPSASASAGAWTLATRSRPRGATRAAAAAGAGAACGSSGSSCCRTSSSPCCRCARASRRASTSGASRSTGRSSTSRSTGTRSCARRRCRSSPRSARSRSRFPVAWYIAKIARGRAKSLLFVLCLIPFWVSETVRTLGWMILLRESGVLPRLLVDLGITAAPVELLYHDATILVGLVYTSMLFMVVPLVSALESLDDSLIEAAYDLGGNGWSILRADRAFRTRRPASPRARSSCSC